MVLGTSQANNKSVAFFLNLLGAFAKLRKANISCVMSAYPHGPTRLPLDGFSWNLVF